MIRVLELFSGIRALSKALEKLGIDYECVDSVEIDKYAIKSQNAIYGTNFKPQDITQWDKDIEVDLIMHGSPCQDFSLAGKQAGGDKDSGTRSSLLYETVRIVSKLKPKYVIWENVKNVLSQKHRHNFDNYLKEMEELGYTNYYQVLNAKDYGIPQNRERVFTVSILNDNNKEFTFPKGELETTLNYLYSLEDKTCYELDFISKTIDYVQENCLYDENDIINPLKNISGKSWQFEQNVYSKDSILRSLKAGGGSGNIPKVIENFEFPPKQDLKLRLKNMLEDEVDEKYYLSDKMLAYMTDMTDRNGFVRGKRFNPLSIESKYAYTVTTAAGNRPTDNFINEPICLNSKGGRGGIEGLQPSMQDRIYDEQGISTAVTTSFMPSIAVREATKKGYKEAYDGDSVNLAYPESETRRGRVGEQVAQTLQCNDNMGVVEIPRIRKLTPLECWRLMGFDDSDFEKASKVCSNSQLYKQAGNSIVVNVLEAILKELFNITDYKEEKQFDIYDLIGVD